MLKLFLKELLDNSQIHDIHSLFEYWHDCEKERPRIMILYVSTCLANMKVPSLYLSSMQMRLLMVNGGMYSVNSK